MGLKINLIPCLFMFILCCNDNKCQIYPGFKFIFFKNKIQILICRWKIWQERTTIGLDGEKRNGQYRHWIQVIKWNKGWKIWEKIYLKFHRKSEQKRLRDRVISEIEASYSEKVGHKKAKKMWRYNQQITAQFDESKFEKEARMGKKCDEESLKISEYILLKVIEIVGKSKNKKSLNCMENPWKM